MTSIQNRYDFVMVFDVQDGNPNGDPDAGNLPRVDPETGHGLVSDVCIKRKLRNYIQLAHSNAAGEPQPGFDIYVREKAVLSAQQGRAYDALGLKADKVDKAEESGEGEAKPKTKGKKNADGVIEKARDQMCKMFFDVRAFGAVMGLKENNAGQVRGAVQVTFARSVDPILTTEHSITRMAVATQKEADAQGGDNRTMGRKNTVPYGLYVAHGFVMPRLAQQTGFSNEDLEALWTAIKNMFEHDRSAARGLMSLQKLVVFKHDNELGSAPAHKLFDLVTLKRKDATKPPRVFADYAFEVGKPPQGVSVRTME